MSSFQAKKGYQLKLKSRVMALPLPSSMRKYPPRYQHHHRELSQRKRQLSAEFREKDISGKWCLTQNNEDWLIYDNMIGGQRILIFATSQKLQTLALSKTWYGDGTFDACGMEATVVSVPEMVRL